MLKKVHQPVINDQRSTTIGQRLIAIMGPTASGKTDVAIQLAKKLGTEIISVDSRQFYREMEIGTAKPSPAELSSAPHHFINHLSIQDEYNAGSFAREAQEKINELFKTHDIVIAVGGSTLYFQALLEGIDEFPEVTPEARERVAYTEKESGIIGLQDALKQVDPVYFTDTDKDNPRRIIRALEVSYSGPHPYSKYLNRKQYVPDYQIVKFALSPDREILYKNIDTRCDEMIASGLLKEVEALYPFRHLKPLHTVGYTEFFDYIDGKMSLDDAITLFKQHTRNYAKRQMTWMRREMDVEWIENAADVIKKLKN